MPRWSTHLSAGLPHANPKLAIVGAVLVIAGIGGWITTESVSAHQPDEPETPSLIAPELR
jgi:hypothetical protein